MASKIKLKILQSSQKNFSILGIDLHQPVQRNPFGEKSVSIIFILCMSVALSGEYFLNVAEEFRQFADSMYATTAMLAAIICFTADVLRKSILSEYIERLEKIINQSELFLILFLTWFINFKSRTIKCILGLEYPESRAMYMEINPKVEKWCEIPVFCTENFLYPSAMFSKFVISYYAYFTSGMRHDVFELPFPFW